MSEFDLTPLRSMLQTFGHDGRTALLPALHAAQSLYGYIPEPVASEVGHALGVPLVDVYGVIDFYTMFHGTPVGETIIQVCVDPACAMSGSDDVLDSLCNHLDVSLDQISPDGRYTVERASCLGLCEHAPVVLIGENAYSHVEPARIPEILKGKGTSPSDSIVGDLRILTANCGNGIPTSLSDYAAKGGYTGLKGAFNMSPGEVITEVKTSGLVGRGGAAFPTGIKWEGAAMANDHPKYVVCNADESEPGTFKDRVLMEEDPHRIIEGMIIAAYAIGAIRGYIYIRGEYPYALKTLKGAVEESRQANYLGNDIFGSGFDFDVEFRRGAVAYICGEETALIESIEGKRGFPRVKPPFPTTYGLFGKPTVINNVETLCNVPFIIEQGAHEYRKLGTKQSPGPKLFCISGDVVRPGLYEVPFGITIRHLIFDLAGGIRNGHNLQAILFGGAAGAFATSDQIDVPLSYEDLKDAGLPLGSGVLLIFDETRDIRDSLKRLTHFFALESCGKCYPCQLGTQRQYEILKRISSGNTISGDVERLSDVGWTMTNASLCGLGQTAASAVLSALKLWPLMFQV